MCEYFRTHTGIQIYTETLNIVIFKGNVLRLRRFHYCTVYNVKLNMCVYLYQCHTSLNYNKCYCDLIVSPVFCKKFYT